MEDAHSAEADRRMALKPCILITRLNRSEVAHAIHLYVFRRMLSYSEAEQSWKDFEKDCVKGVWFAVDLPDRAWETCIDLARQHGPTLGVRTLDSLHVACALQLKAERFWTFDDRQARLAEAVGLDTNS